MEALAHLKLIKPACAGNEIGHGACLLLLQAAVALNCLILGVVKGQVKALMLPVVSPCDQHLLHPDHDVGLACWHLHCTATVPAFTAAIIFSLSFLIIRSINSGRLCLL